MKLGIYNYIGGMTTRANPYTAATTWVVLANTWLVTRFGFLVYLFSFLILFLGSRPARTVGPVLTIYTSYDVFPRKEVPFVSRDNITSHLGVKSPPKRQFWGREWAFSSLSREILKLAYYRNYCIDFNQILHSDKDHQMPFVGGPNTRITNPRWRTAAILEKSKNRHISGAVWPTSTKFGTLTQFGHHERCNC